VGNKNMNIGVVGLGHLGVCLATIFSKRFKVYGVDINEKRIQQIQNREKFFEPQINEYLKKYGHNLVLSSNYDVLAGCDVIFIITQTPSLPSGTFDVSHIKQALTQVVKVNRNCLVVISSTINVGDMDKLKDVHVRIAYNPEFVKRGSIIRDFENPKFVLVGAYNLEDGELVKNIWSKIHDKPVYIVKPIEAEIIKLSLNVSYALGITFANIIGELCERFGANSNKVLDIIYQDRRNYKPGLGFMGPCFPRDVNCFKYTCIAHSVRSGYRMAAFLNDLNNYMVEKYCKLLTSYGKKKIGILGLAYKPNVPYIDGSQSLKIAQKLLASKYEVFVYDELAEENARKELTGKIHFCSSAEECLKNSDIIFIGTSNFKDVKVREKVVLNPWK